MSYRIEKCVKCGSADGLHYKNFLVEPGKEKGRNLCINCGGTDGLYYINRCTSCKSIVTKLEIARSNSTIPFKAACACGGRRTSPSNLRWFENLIPRVMWLTVLYWCGKLSPAPIFDSLPIEAPPLPRTPPMMECSDDNEYSDDNGYVEERR